MYCRPGVPIPFPPFYRKTHSRCRVPREDEEKLDRSRDYYRRATRRAADNMSTVASPAMYVDPIRQQDLFYRKTNTSG
jgi:hypothetical protein